MSLPHLLLSGFMGTGKTTVGRLLASRENVPFLDLDEAVLAAASSPTGAAFTSVGELFTTLGEPAFRRLEAGALTRALAAPAPTVIAAGGGALLDPESRTRALQSARVVTLTASPEVLLARLEQPGQPRRPLLETASEDGPCNDGPVNDGAARSELVNGEPVNGEPVNGERANDSLANDQMTSGEQPSRAPANREQPSRAPANREQPSRAPANREQPSRAPANREQPSRAPAHDTPSTAGSSTPAPTAPPDRPAIVRSLLTERAAAYAESHATIATDERTPEVIAAAVARAWRAPSIPVRLGARSYSARFTGESEAGTIVADVLATLRPSQWFLVTDTTVDSHWGAPFLRAVTSGAAPPAAVVRLIPGEREKHLGAVEQILRTLITAGADRDAVVVAHGGGVASDIAGFAASILLRGVRWLSVPTTLLSMADAAIGGKTGVDLGPAKNAVGAFHQPSAVVIDVRHTLTETPRAFTSGLAEVVKAAAIADPELLAFLEDHTAAARDRDPALLEHALARAIAVKATIVATDERESGPRALLNFGHTLGHALEAAGDFERWTHGEAVSLGMVAALRAGTTLGLTDPATAERITTLLANLGLPVQLDLADIQAALPFLSLDKKRRGDTVRAVFVPRLGQALTRDLPLLDLAHLYRSAASDSAASGKSERAANPGK